MEEIKQLIEKLFIEIKEIKSDIKEIKHHIQLHDNQTPTQSPAFSNHFKNIVHLPEPSKLQSPNQINQSTEIQSEKPRFERRFSPMENDQQTPSSPSINNPLITPRRIKRMNQQIEPNYDLLQLTDIKVDVPTQPRPQSRQLKQNERRFDTLAKSVNKTLKQCKYDSCTDELSPFSFFSHVKELENALIIVETTNGCFGSFHSSFPIGIHNDLSSVSFIDKELFIFEYQSNGNCQIHKPMTFLTVHACFFDEKNQNIFGISNGYWLKTEGNWILDENYVSTFSNQYILSSLTCGEIKRVSVWLCE